MSKNSRKLSILFVMICMAGLSCTRSQHSNDPKGRLTDYIGKSFSVKSTSDKGELIGFLTGSVKARLEGWSEEQFKEAFVDSKREFVKLAFREVKTISPQEVQITYELTYMDPGKDPAIKTHKSQVTNKKLCQLVLENGKWLIADVRNIKEVVEFQNEMSLP